MNRDANIAITGSALVSSLGSSVDELRSNLKEEQKGLSYQHRFSDRIQSPLGEIPWERLGLDAKLESDELLYLASERVIAELFATKPELRSTNSSRLGLFVGTTTSGVSGFFNLQAASKNSGLSVESLLNPKMQQSYLAKRLAERFTIHGPVYTFSSSCAASAQALVIASDALRMGWIDRAIVLGADVLNWVTLHGFDCLQLLDPEYCQPFDDARAGINLSEGAVALLLERSDDPFFPKVISHAALSEAHHITQPSPEGAWMGECMKRALSAARLEMSDLAWINPHGTGTLANDSCEMQAILRAGGSLEQCFPSKRLSGHSLGASGALEVLISILLLEDSPKRFALKNSFGFGGVNVSLVLEGAAK